VSFDSFRTKKVEKNLTTPMEMAAVLMYTTHPGLLYFVEMITKILKLQNNKFQQCFPNIIPQRS